MNVDDSLRDEYGRRQEEMRRHRRRHGNNNNLSVDQRESSSATPSSSEDEDKQDTRKVIKKSPSRSGNTFKKINRLIYCRTIYIIPKLLDTI